MDSRPKRIRKPKKVSETIFGNSSEEDENVDTETCYDKIDCRFHKHNCDKSKHRKHLRNVCAYTCGHCEPDPRSKFLLSIIWQQHFLECKDVAHDCIPVLCHVHAYRTLMQRKCRATCHFCEKESPAEYGNNLFKKTFNKQTCFQIAKIVETWIARKKRICVRVTPTWTWWRRNVRGRATNAEVDTIPECVRKAREFATFHNSFFQLVST